MTSNKGLAGAYNANIVRQTLATVKNYNSQGIKAVLFIVGQKGVSALKRMIVDYDCEIVKSYLTVANDVNSDQSKACCGRFG